MGRCERWETRGRDVMGNIIGWYCKDCGASESFYSGGGMLSFNDSDFVSRSKDGSCGPAMKRLLGDGIPEGWTVFEEHVFYRCPNPNCGGVIEGSAFKIADGSRRGCLAYYVKPDSCEVCGEELAFWDDRTPMSDGELLALCQEHVDGGCPNCGSANVQLARGCWD